MANEMEEGGTTREELMQRVALVEQMIAEGRQATGRHGWIFVMWGLVYVVAMVWAAYLRWGVAAWPVCISVAIAIHLAERARRGGKTLPARARNIEAIWTSLGVTVTSFIVAAGVSHHATGVTYFSAIFFFVGMAHGASAMSLRWGAQGIAAAIWGIGGIAVLFATRDEQVIGIFLTAAVFGMVLFGVYAMWVERRRAAGLVTRHA